MVIDRNNNSSIDDDPYGQFCHDKCHVCLSVVQPAAVWPEGRLNYCCEVASEARQRMPSGRLGVRGSVPRLELELRQVALCVEYEDRPLLIETVDVQ